jgi:hypothetical protein
MRSMAEIWSASNACRRPNVYDSRAEEESKGCDRRTMATTAQIRRLMKIKIAIIRAAG